MRWSARLVSCGRKVLEGTDKMDDLVANDFLDESQGFV